MNRRGFAVVEIFIVAVIVVAFGWGVALVVGTPAVPQGARIIVVDNGAVDNTLRERR